MRFDLLRNCGHLRHAVRHTEQPTENGKSNPTLGGQVVEDADNESAEDEEQDWFGACARACQLLLLVFSSFLYVGSLVQRWRRRYRQLC